MTPAPFVVYPKYPDHVYDATGNHIAQFYGPNATEMAAWFAMTPALRLIGKQMLGVYDGLNSMAGTLNRELSGISQLMPTDGPTQASWQKDATSVQAASA